MKEQIPTTIEDLRGRSEGFLIYRAIAGSQAYGTAHAQSDVDIRGIFVLPAAAYLTLQAPAEQISDALHNEVYYGLRRFVELAATSNPNIIELLYSPADCIQVCMPSARRLIEARDLFLSRMAFDSHVAYALAQIKKARGQNKWVNNPKDEAPPRREEFCWILPREGRGLPQSAYPYRPLRLAEAGVDLNQCHVAALEHCPRVYRLYFYGDEAHGVFRGENIVCESIPLVDEDTRCIGLLIFNEPAYTKAKKDHTHYWTWRQQRNEARWQAQESGALDYDAKNLMHTFRLLLSARAIFNEGFPRVRFEGPELDFLLHVRHGKFAYDDLIARAEELVSELEILRDKSTLPSMPDQAALANLLRDLTEEWERANA